MQGITLSLFDVGPFSFSRQADVGQFYFYMMSFGFSFPGSEAVVQRCSVKSVFLKISQNSQENNVLESLF